MKINQNTWFKIIILLIALIFLLTGFMIGYYQNSEPDSCKNNPLVYGIKQINEKNNDNIRCNCNSLKGKTAPFGFDEEGYKKSFLG